MIHPVNLLYVAWQAPESRRILPVGRLLRVEVGFEFAYIQAVSVATALGFLPLVTFPELREVYRCPKLPPLFSNRLMSRSRPDFSRYVTEFALRPDEAEPFTVLARSGGRRTTDKLEIFAPPRPGPEGVEGLFLARGVRHIPGSEDALCHLPIGAALRVVAEPSNAVNPAALMLHNEQGQRLGYVPDYLANELAQRENAIPNLRVRVVKVNLDPAPVHHRLLCGYAWAGDAEPPLFSGAQYQPLPASAAGAHAA